MTRKPVTFVGAAIIVILTILALLVMLPNMIRSRLPSCPTEGEVILVPTIYDFQNHYVELADHQRLWQGVGKLRILANETPVELVLVSVDEQYGATFAYKRVVNGHASSGSSQRSYKSCQFHVDPVSDLIPLHHPSLIVRPENFDSDWKITEYVEYIKLDKLSHETGDERTPVDELNVYFLASSKLPQSFFDHQYSVFISLEYFHEESDAKKGYDAVVNRSQFVSDPRGYIKLPVDEFKEDCTAYPD